MDRRLVNVLVALGAVLLVCMLLIGAEFAFRWIAPEYALEFQIQGDWEWYTSFDNELGWFNYPLNKEFQTDSRGFRMVSQPTGESNTRILFLGDSVTADIGLQAEDTFVNLLSERFPTITFTNAAVSGYSTLQEYLLYERWNHKLQPTHVVLVFYANDFVDNVDYQGGYPRPIMQSGDCEIVPLPPVPWWRRFLYGISRKSHIFNRVIQIGKSRDYAQYRQQLLNIEQMRRSGSVNCTYNVISRLHEAVLRDNATLIVVLSPSEHMIPTGDPMYTALQQFCGEAGIPVYDLTDPLSAYDTGLYLDDAHYNEAGASAVADALADILVLEGVVGR